MRAAPYAAALCSWQSGLGSKTKRSLLQKWSAHSISEWPLRFSRPHGLAHLCHCRAKAAVHNTQTNEQSSHVPTIFYWQEQAVGQIWPAGWPYNTIFCTQYLHWTEEKSGVKANLSDSPKVPELENGAPNKGFSCFALIIQLCRHY